MIFLRTRSLRDHRTGHHHRAARLVFHQKYIFCCLSSQFHGYQSALVVYKAVLPDKVGLGKLRRSHQTKFLENKQMYQILVRYWIISNDCKYHFFIQEQ